MLNVWGSLGLNFDYDGGPIIENGGPIFLYKQALVVKQVSHNIKSFSYLNDNGQPFVSTQPATQLDRNFRTFFRAGF